MILWSRFSSRYSCKVIGLLFLFSPEMGRGGRAVPSFFFFFLSGFAQPPVRSMSCVSLSRSGAAESKLFFFFLLPLKTPVQNCASSFSFFFGSCLPCPSQTRGRRPRLFLFLPREECREGDREAFFFLFSSRDTKKTCVAGVFQTLILVSDRALAALFSQADIVR